MLYVYMYIKTILCIGNKVDFIIVDKFIKFTFYVMENISKNQRPLIKKMKFNIMRKAVPSSCYLLKFSFKAYYFPISFYSDCIKLFLNVFLTHIRGNNQQIRELTFAFCLRIPKKGVWSTILVKGR